MAMMPYQPGEKRSRREDSDMTEDFHLGLGSDELARYKAEKQGLDQFERIDIAQGKADLSEIDVSDGWHADAAARSASAKAEQAHRADMSASAVEQGRLRLANDRVRKEMDIDELMKDARRTVAKTESEADDAYVSRKLPDVVESILADPTNRELDEGDYEPSFGL